MEFYSLNNLPKATDGAQLFGVPGMMYVVIYAFLGLIVLTGISLVWYAARALIRYGLAPHSVFIGVFGLLMLLFAYVAIVNYLPSNPPAHWLVRTDDNTLIVNCGPVFARKAAGRVPTGTPSILSIPYGEIEWFSSSKEQLYAGEGIVRYLDIKLRKGADAKLKPFLSRLKAVRREAALKAQGRDAVDLFIAPVSSSAPDMLRIQWSRYYLPGQDALEKAFTKKSLEFNFQKMEEINPPDFADQTDIVWNAYLDRLVELNQVKYAVELLGSRWWQPSPRALEALKRLLADGAPPSLDSLKEPNEAKGLVGLIFGDREPVNYVALAFFIGFIAVGLSITFFQSGIVRHALQSNDWPTTEGVITAAHLVKRTWRDSTSTYSLPSVVYRYAVQGKEYEASRIGFQEYYPGIDPQAFINEHTVGSRTMVHYNPDNPSDGCLAPGVKAVHFSPFFIAVIVIAMGAVPPFFLYLQGQGKTILGTPGSAIAIVKQEERPPAEQVVPAIPSEPTAESEQHQETLANAQVFMNKGIEHYNKQMFRESLVDFSRVIELLPNAAGAFLNRGLAYYDLGEFEQAFAEADRAVGLDPELVEAYHLRANTHAVFERYDLAIDDYDKTEELSPDHPLVHQNRGTARYATGDYEGAREDFEQALSMNSENTVALFRLVCVSGEFSPEQFKRARSRLRNRTAELPDPWSTAIARYLTEDSVADQYLIDTAQETGGRPANEKLAEAYFYIGEKLLRNDDREGAVEMFKKSADSDLRAIDETRLAKARLREMNVAGYETVENVAAANAAPAQRIWEFPKELIVGLVVICIGLGVMGLGLYIKIKKIPVQADIFINRESASLSSPLAGIAAAAPFAVGYMVILFGMLMVSFYRWAFMHWIWLDVLIPSSKTIAALIFLSAGIGIVFMVHFITSGTQDTRKWPAVPGIVTMMSAPSAQDVLSGKADPQKAAARITYEYQVDGKTYSSSRISLSDRSASQGFTQYVRDTYQKGKEVTVKYRPDDPREAVLEHTEDNVADVMKGMGYLTAMIFILAGIVMLIISFRS